MATRIEAIGNQQQDFLVVLRLLHLFRCDLNGIVRSSFSTGSYIAQASLNLLNVAREMLTDSNIVIERQQKHLVLRRKGERDFTNGLQGLLQFVTHASAAVDQDADTDRNAEVMGKA